MRRFAVAFTVLLVVSPSILPQTTPSKYGLTDTSEDANAKHTMARAKTICYSGQSDLVWDKNNSSMTNRCE